MPKDTFVLDTNILVAEVRNSPIWQNIKATQELSFENSYISVVSEGEIFSLAAQFKWGDDKIEKLQTFLDTLNIVPINNPQLVRTYVAIDDYNLKS